MENDTTNKSGGEDGGAKKNWRERLGINKELPKIAAEFREEKRAPQRPVVSRPAGSAPTLEAARTGQPVARPAPMAPRRAAPAKPAQPEASRSAEASAATPLTSKQPPQPPVQPPRPEIPQSDFSARLRAQREAAERLAQQRHVAGRTSFAASQANGQEPDGSAGTAEQPVAEAASEASEAGAARPKFTFAPEEFEDTSSAAAPEQTAPAAPTAPVEVGVEPDASPVEQTTAPEAQPQAAPGIVVGVRQPARQIPPRATAAALVPPPASPPPPPLRPTLSAEAGPSQASYVPQQPAFGNAPSMQAGTAPSTAQQAYVRAPQQPPVVEPSPQVPPQAPPQLRAEPPMAAPPVAEARPQRPINYVDRDLEDVFEDTPRPARAAARAGVDDYNAAYRDFEDEFEGEEEERRSGSGPIILILALLTVAAIAGALVYFYRSNAGTSATATDQVPVISAPADPVKTEPDTATQPAQPAQPVGRKQIYDRILGEETLEPETVLPSEEAPQVPAVEPNAATTPSGSDVEPLPLPLPPPPGSSDQQGTLNSPASSQTATMTDSAAPAVSTTATGGKTARADQPLTSAVTTTKVDQTTLAAIPPPEPLADAAGAAATTAGASEPAAVTTRTPATTAPAASAAAILPKPPLPRVKPRRQVAAVSQPTAPAPAPAVQSTFTQTRTTTSGSGPVLLAPQAPATAPAPAPTAPAPADTQSSSGLQLPSFFQNSGTTTRRRTGRLADDDPLAGTRSSVNTAAGTTAAGGAQQLTALQPQPVQPTVTQPSTSLLPPSQTAPARVAPAPAPQPTQPAASGGSGYVVQLASYRSQAEAQNEYQRLRSRHSGIIGNLPSRIQKAELGAAGTFYRLGVGPLGTKQAATNLCNSLIASGEKDCLVRRQ